MHLACPFGLIFWLGVTQPYPVLPGAIFSVSLWCQSSALRIETRLSQCTLYSPGQVPTAELFRRSSYFPSDICMFHDTHYMHPAWHACHMSCHTSCHVLSWYSVRDFFSPWILVVPNTLHTLTESFRKHCCFILFYALILFLFNQLLFRAIL